MKRRTAEAAASRLMRKAKQRIQKRALAIGVRRDGRTSAGVPGNHARDREAALTEQKRDPLQRAAGQRLYIIKKGVDFHYMPLSLKRDERNVSVSLHLKAQLVHEWTGWAFGLCYSREIMSLSSPSSSYGPQSTGRMRWSPFTSLYSLS